MKASIIVPVFNSEKYLEECINSALHQTYPAIEIIAVNDGSTDRSPEILNKYRNRITIINKKRGGVASARNKGINVSTGEWIKLLDNDDILYPNAVADLLEETKNIDEKKTVLYANADFINSKGKIIGHLAEPNNNGLDDFDLNTISLDHNFGIPSTWLMHKSIFERCGLFDEITEHDDYEYHLKCCILFNCRFHLVQKTIAKYRLHTKQFTWQVMRKYKNQDTLANNILNKLPDLERKKYQKALMQFRKRRSTFERIAYFFRPFLKFIPIALEIKLRTMYLKITENRYSKFIKK